MMDPYDRAAPAPDAPDHVPAPDDLGVLIAELRVPLTVLLGRSQLLQRRIRAGQVTNVYACMATLAQVDALVRALDTLLIEADKREPS